MELTKSIIDEIVSYIDFADIREFVKNHPELVKAEETIKYLFFGSFSLEVEIVKINRLDLIAYIKGANTK